MRFRHLALVAAVVFAACDSDSPAGPDTDPEPEPVGVVGDDGGSVETSDGNVKLDFPQNAVSGDTEITVEEAGAEDVPEDPDLVPGTTYDFGPDGTTFTEPVTIELRYDPDQLPEGVDEASLAVHRAEGSGWARVSESTVDTDANIVTGTLTSFSVYGLLSMGDPSAAEAHAGDEQEGVTGQPIHTAPSVRVLNQRGDPLPDVTVEFAVTEGGGSVSDATATTDGDGVAVVGSWTLGALGAQGLTASIEGLDPVVFTATAVTACEYTAPYVVGETVEGTLGDPDCVTGAGRYADYYELEVDQTAEVTLSMNADGFEPIIGVFAEDGTHLVAQYSTSRGFTRALLAPGSYRIGARRMDTDSSTVAPDAPAPYTLAVEETTHTVESCDASNNVYVTPGVTATGALTEAHCVDSFADDPEQRFAHYPITMRAGTTYRMTLTADTAASLSLWGADGQHKDLAGTSEAGTVELTYTAQQDGFHGVAVLGHPGVGYDLQLEEVSSDVAACDQTQPYTVGATSWGVLTDQSCVDSQGRYTEYHELEVEEQLSVTLSMSSGEFDPFIAAFDSEGRLVVTQYVASPGFTRGVFAPGSYRLAARSAGEAVPGWYDMSAQPDDHLVDECDVSANVFVTPGVSIDGQITAGDCVDELAEVEGLHVEGYPVRLMPGDSLSVELSAGAHARLSLWNPAGENSAFEAIEESGSVSIDVVADQEGWYTLYAIAYPDTDYTISFSERGTSGAAAPSRSSGPLAAGGAGSGR